MARTATVTKGEVSKHQDNSYTISMHLVYAEDTQELFAKTYLVQYVSGENATSLAAQIKKDMQADIDAFKASQTLLNSATFTNLVAAVQAALVV